VAEGGAVLAVTEDVLDGAGAAAGLTGDAQAEREAAGEFADDPCDGDA